MKVILSRKGFDSSFGKIASPIFEDNTILSLPIPESGYKKKFTKIHFRDKNFHKIIGELSAPKPNRITENEEVHLDQDLRRDVRNVPANWKATFGQSDAAQGHLANQNVEVGDLFLFFGWFRQTEYNKDGLGKENNHKWQLLRRNRN